MKYVSLDFHVNYFAEHDIAPKYHVFGFTVEDPNGSVTEAIDDEDAYVTILEELEDIAGGAAVDTSYELETQFFGAHVYELGENQLDIIRAVAATLRKSITELGGIVGPLVEIDGDESICNHAKLKKELGI